MFQRKLIAVFGVVALLALTAGVSQASLSRVEGMGLTSPVLSQFTDDYVNIYYYPTSVVRQNNLVLAELGHNTRTNGGVDPVAHNDQSLTLIKNFPHFGTLAYQMSQTAQNSTFSSNLNNEQLDLIYGIGLAKIDLAVRLDITNSSTELDDNAGPTHVEAHGIDLANPFNPYPFGTFDPDRILTSGVELNTWGVSPAIALHLANDNRIEGMVGLRRYSLDRNITTASVAGPEWKDSGNMSYVVAVRGILHQGDRGTWYPALWYVNDDMSYEVNNVALTKRGVDETYKDAGLGISHNMRVNDNNLLIFGVAVDQAKHTYERTDNNDGVASAAIKKQEDKITTEPVVFAALETQLTHWLTARLGGTKAMVASKTDISDFAAPTGTTSEKERGGTFQFSLGTGIKFNNFDVDMTLNQAFPLSGGWILSGDPATPFTRVSGTYHF